MSLSARVQSYSGLSFLFQDITYTNSTAPFFTLGGITSEIDDQLIPVDIRFQRLTMSNNTIWSVNGVFHCIESLYPALTYTVEDSYFEEIRY